MASKSIDREISIHAGKKSRCHTAFATASETRASADFVAAIEDPAAPLVGLDEPGAAQQSHVVRRRRLGEADGRFDVARAETPLVDGHELAAGLPAGAQEVQDLQAGGIAEGLEGQNEIGRRGGRAPRAACDRELAASHRSINIDISVGPVKPGRRPHREAARRVFALESEAPCFRFGVPTSGATSTTGGSTPATPSLSATTTTADSWASATCA